MCYLKIADSDPSEINLTSTIEDCTQAIQLLDTYKSTADSKARPLRSKLLYRRARARATRIFQLIGLKSMDANSSSSSSSDTNESSNIATMLKESRGDLQDLLSFDPTNKAAKTLLQTIQLQSAKYVEQLQGSASTPIVRALKQLSNNDNDNEPRSGKQRLDALRFISVTLSEDLKSACEELIKSDQEGLAILWRIALDDDEAKDCRACSMRALTTACSNEPFAKLFLGFDSSCTSITKRLEQIVTSGEDDEDLLVSCLKLLLCSVLTQHLMDDDSESISTDEQCTSVCNTCIHGFRSSSTKRQSLTLDLLSAWLEPNPLMVLSSICEYSGRTLKEPTEQEVRSMAPRKLAFHRKKTYEGKKRRTERSHNNARQFCRLGGLNALIAMASFTDNARIRRECIVNMGRLVNHLVIEQQPQKGENDDTSTIDDATKKVLAPFLGWSSSGGDGLTIEEIHEDEEKEIDIDEDLKLYMRRGIFTASLLLANGEIGKWALLHGWSNGCSKSEWESLVSSGELKAMSIAAEIVSAASSVEGSRPWVMSCIGTSANNNSWKELLTCTSREVRSGAASAMAKLGLADKGVSSDEGELFSLMEVASGLLGSEDEDIEPVESTSTSLADNSDNEPRERGIELLNYLASKTMVKDELAHGYMGTGSDESILESLIKISRHPESLSTGAVYALSNIFTSLAVSIETLRKEAFEGKDITADQYEQLQAMGKTEEEKELEEKKREKDSPDAVRQRIEKMSEKNVPRVLVTLMKDATDATQEKVVLCMVRMATEESVRGAMIQQGCLTACINIIKDENASNVEKKIILMAEHTIAKLLVTMNPSMLTTPQRMGSIKSLMELVKDNESTDLQQFEALLSLTNLGGFDDELKNRIVAERGISVLSYAMFSSHEMVRRAATEAMSNLVPHPDVLEHFRQPDKLKLWVAFSSDFEENFECSRAALGCLAMISQDSEIALQLAIANHTPDMMKEVLECGNLELMHRLLVILLNLVAQGGKCKETVISTGSLAFCGAYVQSYHDGGRSKGVAFGPEDQGLFKVTLDLAKEVVNACS
jgi:hypothetical protein